jgi:hypothetical protein
MVSSERSNIVEQAGLPNGGQDLLGEADVATAAYVVTVTVNTRTRGEILTSRSHLLNTLGRGYARASDEKLYKEMPSGTMKKLQLS